MSKAQITLVKEFERSMIQVSKCHTHTTQQAKYAYQLEHTTGTTCVLAAMCTGYYDCFDRAWEQIAKDIILVKESYDEVLVSVDSGVVRKSVPAVKWT